MNPLTQMMRKMFGIAEGEAISPVNKVMRDIGEVNWSDLPFDTNPVMPGPEPLNPDFNKLDLFELFGDPDANWDNPISTPRTSPQLLRTQPIPGSDYSLSDAWRSFNFNPQDRGL